MAKPRRAPSPKAATVGTKLQTYRAKRDFEKTPEPPPEDESSQIERAEGKKKERKNAAKADAALAFVVQKHDATRLHYDVRIEIGGAMMSWAVPKGPSYDPAIKRLAVETEDHPMAYNQFEGRIPDGEYGAGDVLIWDRGTYETVPPGQADAMRAKGHFHVRFFGEKLRGDWHFVRTRRDQDGAKAPGGEPAKAQWLMFKAADATANPALDIIASRPESVVSGKSATRGPRRIGASQAGKNALALLDAVGDVAKATLATHPPDPKSFWFEIKYDGYRILMGKAGDEVRLLSRNGKDWTAPFQVVADAARSLPVREAVIDGEVCAVDDDGTPSFQGLQEWVAGERKRVKIAYVAFDLLWVDGRDLRALPIEERRQLLEALFEKATGPLSFSRAIAGDDLAKLLHVARASGLEGLVAKRRGSPYVGGHSSHWLKIKFTRRQDCAIAGYVPISDGSGGIGALLLAVVDEGVMRFAGRVGTGFDSRTRSALAKRLDAIAVPKPQVAMPRTPGAVFCALSLACEVEFGEWTRDGSMRRPSFMGLREDKSPSECVVETDGIDPDAPAPAPGASNPSAPSAPSSSSSSGALPPLANPRKVLYPRDGITKKDVLDYYLAVAPFMLPHLASRPLTLQRWPNGIDGEEWYQQNAPDKIPGFVRLIPIEGKSRIVADNVETLAWLANLAALTIHQWASHAPRLEAPDYVVLDLDPGDGPWSHVIEVAGAVRALLEALELDSVVKTSGKRGIHVLVPIAPGPSHAEATAFGEQIAKAVAKVLPSIATAERMKDKRRGRLYVDYLQNGEGKTIVAPYTLRALDGAPVSTPIAWSEVTEKLDPRGFTLRNVLDRLAKTGDLFAGALNGHKRLPRV
jgi:bifunctional non-homologous end joining protein LigD